MSGACEPGIQGLKPSHRRLISCADGRLLTGSVDLDAALLETHPNAPRWDYGIGLRQGNRECAVWVEVHSAQTNKVREVLNKHRWLKDWLSTDAEPLERLTRTNAPAFIWLASGSIKLPRHLPQAKRALQEGIYPRKRLELP